MPRSIAAAAALAALLGGCAAARAEAPETAVTDRTSPPGRSPDFNPAGRGQAAVQAEFDAAARADTVQAWDLFLARHPDNPLAADARARRARLQTKD